ncbi:MAG: acetone carboxylase subunit gamma [Salinisphaera sp.]|nr:acetone carboxylase subunit gamma [Salinisphaera sp.]
MYERIRFTEYLDLDLDRELWVCHDCGQELISARENYKKGCLVADREPAEVHPPVMAGDYGFVPDPEWIHVLEFYCPGCARQIEVEYLPPGHPVTHDIEVDLDALKRRLDNREIEIRDGKICRPNSQEAAA